MEVEYEITKTIYNEFYKISIKEKIQKRIVLISILFFFVVSVICSDHLTLLRCILTVIGYFIFIATLSYYLPLWIIMQKLNKLLLKGKLFLGKSKITITDEGLMNDDNPHSVRIWESIKAANSNEKFIYVTLIDKKILIIPKKYFANELEAINFLGLIQTKNKKQGVPYQTSYIPEKNPPYSLGFLCIVPLVGAFVGVALILYGLIKYKDKWLVLIGAGGILFTVFIYGTLFYVGFKSDMGRKGFAQLSQMEINTLVNQIEFYKFQNGAYPDSLQQLDIKGEFIDIHDPLLDNKNPDYYNYHRVGNKYTLFSSGLDEKPNTADDIYPNLQIDTNKVGLIIDRKK